MPSPPAPSLNFHQQDLFDRVAKHPYVWAFFILNHDFVQSIHELKPVASLDATGTGAPYTNLSGRPPQTTSYDLPLRLAWQGYTEKQRAAANSVLAMHGLRAYCAVAPAGHARVPFVVIYKTAYVAMFWNALMLESDVLERMPELMKGVDVLLDACSIIQHNQSKTLTTIVDCLYGDPYWSDVAPLFPEDPRWSPKPDGHPAWHHDPAVLRAYGTYLRQVHAEETEPKRTTADEADADLMLRFLELELNDALKLGGRQSRSKKR